MKKKSADPKKLRAKVFAELKKALKDAIAYEQGKNVRLRVSER